jgi:hypothetical protein
VRSAAKASAELGSTARTRAVASRTAAIFAARSALSTTGCGGAQDPGGTPLFNGLEVEILEKYARLAGHQRSVVALDEQAPVAEDPIGERRGRLVEEHEVDAARSGGLQACRQAAESLHVPRRAGGQSDGDVGVATRVRRSTSAGPEEQGVRDTGLGFEDVTKRV